MDVETLAKFVSPLVAGAALAWSVMQYRLGARKAEMDKLATRVGEVAARAAADVAALEDKIDEDAESGRASREEVIQRLTAVEGQLAHMPDKDTVHRLEVSVTEIKGDVRVQGEAVKGLTGSLQSVSATTQRIETFLLESKK